MHVKPLLRLLTIVAAFAATSAYALASDLPSYATGEESIKGTVASISGKYRLSVRDDRGYIDDVTLHDGTVINPTGLRLATGQSVTILGHNAGSTFAANEIDTPYSERSGITYAYPYLVGGPYGGPYPYAYPVYPYNYGPSFSLGLFFGGGYYGRGYYGRGYYGHPGYYGRGYYGHPGLYGRAGYLAHGAYAGGRGGAAGHVSFGAARSAAGHGRR